MGAIRARGQRLWTGGVLFESTDLVGLYWHGLPKGIQAVGLANWEPTEIVVSEGRRAARSRLQSMRGAR